MFFLTLPRLLFLLLTPVLVTGVVVYDVVESKPRPTTFSLAVPFTTQAPDGAWENNANCEEASALMASAFLAGDTREDLPAAEAKRALDTLVRWEHSNLGYHIDTGIGEIGAMIEANFHLTTEELADFTEDDLKQELFENHVIILPVNLKLLGSAKYQGAGNDYHVVVIRGYTETDFVVNDPGTTSGKNNLYSFATIQSAAADWDNANQKLNPDKKVVLVVSK